MTLSYIPSDTNDEGILKATASGILPSGQPVIVNADGTVSVVAETAVSQSVGSPQQWGSSSKNTYFASTYDANAQKLVIAYQDVGNSNRGTAIVGTVSGTNISFGSAAVFETGITRYISCAYDPNVQKIVIAFTDQSNGNYGKAVVATVSGTNISFGSVTNFNNGATYFNSTVYDETAQKIVIAYRDVNRGAARVCTISGTSISFGTETQFDGAADINQVCSVYDSSAQKIVIVYRGAASSYPGRAVVGAVSGTSISFGSVATFNTGFSTETSAAYDANAQRVVIVYRDQGNSYYATSIVGTVSGTSISFGTAVVFESALVSTTTSTYDPNAKKVVISYLDSTGNSNYPTAIVGTVSNTSISFSTPVVLQTSATGGTDGATSVYDQASKKVVIAYQDTGNSNNKAVVFQAGYTAQNLTAENYIGMSSGVVVQTGSAGSTGSEVVFDGQGKNFSGAYDTTNNKVLIAYRDVDNSSQGTAIVGTVSGSSISFGSPAIFETQSTLSFTSVSFDSTAGKLLISYRDGGNSNYGTAIVATISGTSVSFGTPTVFESANALYISSAYDASNNKTVIAYRDNDNSSYGTAVIGTISGTSVSFGTPVVFEAGATNWTNTVYDSSNNKIVIAYSDGGNGDYLTAIVGTLNGTSISFGSASASAQSTSYIGAAFDSINNKVVIASRNNDASSVGVALVGTVSGTSISLGSPVTFTGADTYQTLSVSAVSFDTDSGGVLITYEGGNDRDATAIRGVVSGTSISFGTAVVLDTGGSHEFIGNVYDPDQNKNVVFYKDAGNSNAATAIVFQPSTIVTTRAEVASGSNAVIDIGSAISTNQLSLTAGQQYFVQTDGTLGLTAGSPSVIAGTAISATDIIVKG
jgi:hypothetical protein